MLKTDATGMFSQRSVQALGFTTVSETRYDTHKNEDGSLMFPVPPPHQSLKIMQKQLNNTENNNHCA